MLTSSYDIPWDELVPYLGLSFILLFCIYPFALRVRQTAKSNAEAKSKFLTDAKALIKAGLAEVCTCHLGPLKVRYRHLFDMETYVSIEYRQVFSNSWAKMA